MKETKRYRSPSREGYVEIGLDEFQDDEIKAEFGHRFGPDAAGLPPEVDPDDEPITISGLRLREIVYLQRMGRHAKAARAIDDLIRDTLGTAL